MQQSKGLGEGKLGWEDASEGGGQSAERREQKGSDGGVRQRLNPVVMEMW